jgi:hypothetical protein
MQDILDIDARIATAKEALRRLKIDRIALLRSTPLPDDVSLKTRPLMQTLDVLVDGTRVAIVRVRDSGHAGTEYFPDVRLDSGSGYSTVDKREAVWVALIAIGYGKGDAPKKCMRGDCSLPPLTDVALCIEHFDAIMGNPVAGLRLIPGGAA